MSSQPEQMGPSRALTATVLSVTVVVAAVLRFLTVGHLALRHDEFWTLQWSAKPASEVLQNYVPGLTMHLYILLTGALRSVFGSAPLTLKLPSLVCGVALVPLGYWVGTRWFGREVGLVTSVWLAVSVPTILSAREARVYPMFMLVEMALLVVLVDYLRKPDWSKAILLAVGHAVGLALTLHGVYFLPVHVLIVAVHLAGSWRSRWRHVLRLAGPMALSGAAVTMFYWQALPAIRSLGPKMAGGDLRLDIFVGAWEFNLPVWTLPSVALAGLGSVIAIRRFGIAGLACVLWAIVPPLLLLIHRPRFSSRVIARYLLPYLPAIFLLASLGLWFLACWLARGRLSRGTLVVCLVLLVGLAPWTSQAARNWIWLEGLPTDLALKRLRQIVKSDDVVTYENPGYRWLLDTEPRIKHDAVHLLLNRRRAPEGRLIVLSETLHPAMRSWRQHFTVEVLTSSRNMGSMTLLVSPPIEARPDALLRPLAAYLDGLIEVDRTGRRLRPTQFRQQWTLGRIYSWKVTIAERLGDSEAASEYHERATRHQEEAERLASGIR